ARFQARSAYYGVGFTTTESEDVVNEPGRRRIIMTLALLGNAGVATTIASLMLSFSGTNRGQAATRVGVIVAAFVAIALLAHSGRLDRYFSRLAQRALRRWTNLELRDYAHLLGVHGGFTVGQLRLHPDDWLTERALRDLDLPDEGVQVLGVIRADGDYVGIPDGATLLSPGDTVVLYGHTDQLADLDVRRKGHTGDEAHRRAVTLRRSDRNR
ncbi:MAG: TrkA C-terminal domain-containing protein, partial [Frankiaceae bacterium]|nr:TrkA C-terminal domain-containing protein [Frankiaceae bacterium]MBV9369261.1 TrkA C-terminal domain-containing protein [Frankiales bacterium]